ncbi:MAG: DMT family transporter [bacterium]
MLRKLFKLYLSPVAAASFWAMSFIWYKMAYESFQPMTVIFFRQLFSALLLIFIGKFFSKIMKLRREDIKILFLLSFFQPLCYFIGESYGVKFVSSSVAAIIISTIPVFTPFFGKIFMKEKISFFNYAGLFLSFIGIVLMVVNRDFSFDAHTGGVLLMFLAVFSAIGFAITAGNLTRIYNTFTIVTWQNIFGSLMFLPIFFIVDFDHISSAQISFSSVKAIIYLTVFASITAFFCFLRSVRELGVTKTNVFINLIPVITALAAWILLDEEFSALKLSGMIVVICGLFISQKKRNTAPDKLVKLK